MDVGGQSTGNEVQILTLRAARGLEWPMVFLPGWEEEVFPSRRSLDESGMKGLEEERRLACVGATLPRPFPPSINPPDRLICGANRLQSPPHFPPPLKPPP